MMNSLREDPKYLQFRRNFHFNLQGYQSVEFQQPFDVTGCIGLGNDAKINKTIYDKQDIMMKWFYRKKSGEHEIKNGIITIGKKGIISRFTKREVIHLLGGLNIVKGMATELIGLDFSGLYKVIFNEQGGRPIHEEMPYRSNIVNALIY